MAIGNVLSGGIKNGAELAIGVSLGIGGIALVNHLLHKFIGIGIPHEFILWPRGCCAHHPHHQCGGCRNHGHGGHHMMAYSGTMNTLGPSGGGRYHLY